MTDQNGSAPAGNPAPGAGGSGAPAGEWYAGIPDEGLRGYVQTKGFKDPAALAGAYQNLEKLVGVPQERLLKLPEKADDPAWDGVYNRLGRPEKPDGYELKFDGDDALAKRMAAAMHKAGVPKQAAGVLNEEWNAYVTELIEADTRAQEQRDKVEIDGLKAKWGGDYEKNVELGRRAGREFGLSEDEFKAVSASLGPGKTLELFSKIGSKLGEAGSFDAGSGSGGAGGGFGMSADGAKARIQALTQDKDWTAKYLNGDVSARDEMTRLQQIASGGR